MLDKGAHAIVLLSAGLLLFVSVALAVIEGKTVRFEQPVKAIRGRVTAFGQVMRVVWVDVYDNAQLCLDDSMSEVERRKRQTKVASVEPNDKGEFRIRHLPKGFYEVEIGNHGGGRLQRCIRACKRRPQRKKRQDVCGLES
jgi:hypothetical protein